MIDKDNYCSQYYLYLMQMCYMNRIFYRLGQGVSGLGRWRLQADKFMSFSITVPSYEEQKEIACKERAIPLRDRELQKILNLRICDKEKGSATGIASIRCSIYS